MVRGLRTVGAVLGAAASLHAEERAELHLVVLVIGELHLTGTIDQLEERQIVQGAGLLQIPVVANDAVVVAGRGLGGFAHGGGV